VITDGAPTYLGFKIEAIETTAVELDIVNGFTCGDIDKPMARRPRNDGAS
jgi:hypothetical protein